MYFAMDGLCNIIVLIYRVFTITQLQPAANGKP